MLPPKPNDCRPAYKNQANFDHDHKNKSFDLHTKNKSFSARARKPRQFWPPLKKQGIFDPQTKTKSTRIPHTKENIFSALTLMSS